MIFVIPPGSEQTVAGEDQSRKYLHIRNMVQQGNGTDIEIKVGGSVLRLAQNNAYEWRGNAPTGQVVCRAVGDTEAAVEVHVR